MAVMMIALAGRPGKTDRWVTRFETGAEQLMRRDGHFRLPRCFSKVLIVARGFFSRCGKCDSFFPTAGNERIELFPRNFIGRLGSRQQPFISSHYQQKWLGVRAHAGVSLVVCVCVCACGQAGKRAGGREHTPIEVPLFQMHPDCADHFL